MRLCCFFLQNVCNVHGSETPKNYVFSILKATPGGNIFHVKRGMSNLGMKIT